MSYKVLGYIKPVNVFKTLDEWKEIATSILAFQQKGYDTRDGEFRCVNTLKCSTKEFAIFQNIVMQNFGYLTQDVDRFDRVVSRNLFNFIEDFVNYRIWAMEREFGSYFLDINRLRFAFFYTRDDIEPYVLLDDEFTIQTYGSTNNPKQLFHYTTEKGFKNITESLFRGEPFDISCFTIMDRPFFRQESNLLITLVGNVRAGFRSDVKSFVVSNGRRACNMYRLEYPGSKSNLCYELETCDGKNLTSLWNEYIATPMTISGVERR
jgi:hypothetical protein